jgi:hypothetical protein
LETPLSFEDLTLVQNFIRSKLTRFLEDSSGFRSYIMPPTVSQEYDQIFRNLTGFFPEDDILPLVLVQKVGIRRVLTCLDGERFSQIFLQHDASLKVWNEWQTDFANKQKILEGLSGKNSRSWKKKRTSPNSVCAPTLSKNWGRFSRHGPRQVSTSFQENAVTYDETIADDGKYDRNLNDCKYESVSLQRSQESRSEEIKHSHQDFPISKLRPIPVGKVQRSVSGPYSSQLAATCYCSPKTGHERRELDGLPNSWKQVFSDILNAHNFQLPLKKARNQSVEMLVTSAFEVSRPQYVDPTLKDVDICLSCPAPGCSFSHCTLTKLLCHYQWALTRKHRHS